MNYRSYKSASFLFLFPILNLIKTQHLKTNSTINYALVYPSVNKSDVILGALFPIHSSTLDSESRCGSLQEEDGIYPLEAFLFTIDQINKDKTLLPEITLGALAFDSCNAPEVALYQSLKFMKGFIAIESMHQESDFKCTDNGTLTYQDGKYNKIVGVIGGQHSSVSVAMANVLRLVKIPQISYRSTASSLGDNKRYPYFLRTIPSDNNQAEVIIEVLKYLNVTYASLVYSETEYGRGGAEELREKASRSSICFSSPAFSVTGEDSRETFDEIANSLVKNENANVIILFADLETASKLFESFKNKRKFIWIGSDAWTSSSSLVKEHGDILEGAIGVQPLAKTLPGFRRYFKRLTPENNLRNPWFREFWEYKFNCSLDSDEHCKNFSMRNSRQYIDVKWTHLVRDAVYAFAYGLHSMWESHCQGKRGLCKEMTHDGHVHGEELYMYLKNVTFQDISDEEFHFQPGGDGPPRYTISIVENIDNSPLWVPVANFSHKSESPNFAFIRSDVEFALPVASLCGKPCGKNEEKSINNKDRCCWQCLPCEVYQYLNGSTSSCQKCDRCQKPNLEGTGCYEKQDKYMDFSNEWAITSIAFACLGIISTILVGVIFWVYFDTPVIKAASRELSYILLSGILISFMMTFAILAPPNKWTCGITRFFIGFSYTVCYAAILTKTNRIYRIFQKSPTHPQKTKYTSPSSQLGIVFLLVSIEVIIITPWLLYYRPEEKRLCDIDVPYNTVICKGIDDYSYIVGLVYPFFLISLCIIYAIKTRKCPDGFNEAKYIAFTNYTTCIIWLIFVPLYVFTPTKNIVRLVSLAMSLSLGAFVQLACLFFPKVHIVLFKPEKNTRDSVMCLPKGSSNGNPNSIHRPGLQPHSAPAIVFVKNAGNNINPAGSQPPQKSVCFAVNDGLVNPTYLTVPSK